MKKFLIVFMTTIVTFLGVTVYSFYATSFYADGKLDPSKDSRFSKYLNVMVNGTYNKEVEIDVLHHNPKYNISENYKLSLPDEVEAPSYMPNVSVFKEYGFKVNKEFYIDSLKLDKVGRYNIEVCPYVIKDDIVYPKVDIYELFSLTIIDDSTSLFSKTDFYYEHYLTPEDMTKDIEGHLVDSKMSLTIGTVETIKRLHDTYTRAIGTEGSDKYYSKDLDKKGLQIEVYFNNQIYKTKIDVLSTEGEDIKMVTDYKTIFGDIKPIAFNVLMYDESVQGQDVVDVLGHALDIKLNVSNAQKIKYEITKGVQFPVFYGSTKAKTMTIMYNVTDYTTGKTYTYARPVCFYNRVLKIKDVKTVVESNSDGVLIYSKPTVLETIKGAYVTVEEKGLLYYDYGAVENISFYNGIPDTSKISERSFFSLKISLATSKETSEQEIKAGLYVKVVDNLAPIILTRYNKYFVDANEKDLYMKDIRVIDNYSNKIQVEYSLKENDRNGGIITVTAIDEAGNKSVLEIPFEYRKISFFNKTIGKALYNYGKFLRSVF